MVEEGTQTAMALAEASDAATLLVQVTVAEVQCQRRWLKVMAVEMATVAVQEDNGGGAWRYGLVAIVMAATLHDVALSTEHSENSHPERPVHAPPPAHPKTMHPSTYITHRRTPRRLLTQSP